MPALGAGNRPAVKGGGVVLLPLPPLPLPLLPPPPLLSAEMTTDLVATECSHPGTLNNNALPSKPEPPAPPPLVLLPPPLPWPTVLLLLLLLLLRLLPLTSKAP